MFNTKSKFLIMAYRILLCSPPSNHTGHVCISQKHCIIATPGSLSSLLSLFGGCSLALCMVESLLFRSKFKGHLLGKNFLSIRYEYFCPIILFYLLIINNTSQHLLNVYHKPGTVVSTFQINSLNSSSSLMR